MRKIVLGFLIAVSITLTFWFIFIFLHRLSLDYNDEGRFYDSKTIVVYQEQAVFVYGLMSIICGIFTLVLILFFIKRYKIMKIITIFVCLLLITQSKICFAQDGSPTWMVQAETFKAVGNFESAIVEYNKAIEYEPNNAEYYYRRGLTYVQMLNYVLAVEDFEKTIALKPKYYQGYGASATVYAILQNKHKAMQQYDTMCTIKTCPDEYKAQVKAKIVSSLQDKEFEKLTIQYTEYFLLFLKSF
jgi:hypothetical protein